MTARCDIVVVGGGIIGLATTMALIDRGRESIVVLEAEDRIAAHQTGHNSGVIHAGLYYRPGSLKARLCREGREALYRFCATEGVPHRRTGKLVVATAPAELPGLAELEARGRANGLSELRRVPRGELRELEPEVTGEGGLWVGETGVVDYAAVAAAYARRITSNGGGRGGGVEIRTGARVSAIREHGTSRLIVETAAGAWDTALLVNCGGLEADRIARLAGVEPGVLIVPFRGEYYELVPERAHLVRQLIYPVPDPRLPFLGVHLTRAVDNRVHLGPNAVLAFRRTGYRRSDISARDLMELLAFPGFWRMARKYVKAGFVELGRSLSRRLFVRAVQRLVPAVRDADVVPAPSGVRAQAVDRAGRLLDDFHIVEGDRSIHVVNAPSPAATASLSIGRYIADKVLARLQS